MPPVDEDLIGGAQKAHLIGIGGVGMSGLARVLQHLGLKVSGSDQRESDWTRALEASGITVRIGHDPALVEAAELVIYSSAIRPDHPERLAAHESGKRVYHRAEILASLVNHVETSVAVMGSHGKTTTSSMISFVLKDLHYNPTCLVGGKLLNYQTNALLGDTRLWVCEVDESDQSHELFAPHYAVITNLEEDHMDHYESFDRLRRSFQNFLENVRNPGLIIYNGEDSGLTQLVRENARLYFSFGFSPDKDLAAQQVLCEGAGCEFDLWEAGLFAAHVKLSVAGRHNVANALAAIAVLIHLGLDLDAVLKSLAKFRGAHRRLEVCYETETLTVVDDYAHHPTEVRAALEALRGYGKPVTAIFQPHRYSRTRHFVREFGRAFKAADKVILIPIYGAGEANDGQVSVDGLYHELIASGHPSVLLMARAEILDYLKVQEDTERLVAFLGAGDIGDLAREYADGFESVLSS